MNGMGDYLRDRLAKMNLTQKEFATKLGISPAYVHDLIVNRRGNHLTDERLEQIARILEISRVLIYLLAGRITPEVLEAVYKQPEMAEHHYRYMAEKLGTPLEEAFTTYYDFKEEETS